MDHFYLRQEGEEWTIQGSDYATRFSSSVLSDCTSWLFRAKDSSNNVHNITIQKAACGSDLLSLLVPTDPAEAGNLLESVHFASCTFSQDGLKGMCQFLKRSKALTDISFMNCCDEVQDTVQGEEETKEVLSLPVQAMFQLCMERIKNLDFRRTSLAGSASHCGLKFLKFSNVQKLDLRFSKGWGASSVAYLAAGVSGLKTLRIVQFADVTLNDDYAFYPLIKVLSNCEKIERVDFGGVTLSIPCLCTFANSIMRSTTTYDGNTRYVVDLGDAITIQENGQPKVVRHAAFPRFRRLLNLQRAIVLTEIHTFIQELRSKFGGQHQLPVIWNNAVWFV